MIHLSVQFSHDKHPMTLRGLLAVQQAGSLTCEAALNKTGPMMNNTAKRNNKTSQSMAQSAFVIKITAVIEPHGKMTERV